MKTFKMFQEDLSRNVIPLDQRAQDNLNKAKRGQTGPGAKGVPQTVFKLVPVNIPLK